MVKFCGEYSKTSTRVIGVRLKDGARSRNRTGTVFLPRDFKSLASTSSAIRAYCSGKTDLEWCITRRERQFTP